MRKGKHINGFKAKTATRDCYTKAGDMPSVAGLIRRGSAYSYRRRVPEELRETIGKRELWIALGTTDYRAACVAARREAVKVDALFEAAKKARGAGEAIAFDSARVSEAGLRHIAIRELWEGERAAGTALSGLSGQELQERFEEAVADLRANDENTSATLFDRAVRVIRRRGIDIPIPAFERGSNGLPLHGQGPIAPVPEFLRLMELLRRAEMEALERGIDRVKGGHGDHAHDPLFEGINSLTPPSAVKRADRMTLGDAIHRFETDPTRANLTDSADRKYVSALRALREIVGDEKPLEEIERRDCAAAHELLAGLPPNIAKLKPYAKCATLADVAKLATERGDKRLAPGTLRVSAHALASFFNWAIRKGLLSANPATRLAEARGPAEVSRRPFSSDELKAVVGGLGAWAASAGNAKGGRYWVPLIAIFSGMRLGEIVTLGVDDVGETDGVTCFVLRRTEERSLKTAGAERVVPVHPELKRLGLLKLVADRKKAGEERLFPDLPGDNQRRVADLFQKRFSYWLRTSLKIDEPGVSFHSFRHGFRDALREAGVPIDATRALGGWARSGGVEERYGQGTRPATLARWLKEVQYPGLLAS